MTTKEHLSSTSSSSVSNDLKALRPKVANVWGLPVYVGDVEQFARFFCDHFEELRGRSLCIGSPEVYALILSQRNRAHLEALKRYFLLLPDGRTVAVLARMQSRGAARCRGAENMEAIIRSTTHLGVKHFLIGPNEEVLSKLKNKATEQWGDPQIAGTYAPPYLKNADNYDYKAISSLITRTKADVVWVGLSSPKQDILAARLSEMVRVTAIFPVGAAFNFHAGTVSEAPRWMQKAPLPIEWTYRVVEEPRRMLPRYLYTLFWLPYYLIRNFIRKKPLS